MKCSDFSLQLTAHYNTASEKHSMFNQRYSARFNLLGVMQTNPVIM